jgi:hypothetical protein
VRQGSIDLLVAFSMTCPAAIAANLGAHFSRLIPPTWLYFSFGTLLLGVLALYYTAPQTRAAATSEGTKTPARSWYVLPRQRIIADVPYRYNLHVINAALSGLGAGLLTGFFGVGGGFLLVPLGVIVLRIPLRVTIGTALAVTILPACVATLSHWHAGHVDMPLWLSLVVTGIVGSQIGARYVVRFPPQRLKNLFLLLLLAGACLMFVKGLTTAAG